MHHYIFNRSGSISPDDWFAMSKAEQQLHLFLDSRPRKLPVLKSEELYNAMALYLENDPTMDPPFVSGAGTPILRVISMQCSEGQGHLSLQCHNGFS